MRDPFKISQKLRVCAPAENVGAFADGTAHTYELPRGMSQAQTPQPWFARLVAEVYDGVMR